MLTARCAKMFLSFAACVILCGGAPAQQSKRTPKTKADETSSTTSQKSKRQQAGGEPSADELNDELDTISVKKPAEQIVALKEFLQYEAPKDVRAHAKELLINAYAASGNAKLRAGDVAGGMAEFREAVKIAPSKPTEDDKLFVAVVQLPANLFLRGETAAAIDLAHSIEAKAAGNPQRLLAIAIFYLGVEQDAEAVRVASDVVRLAPNMSEAYQTLGAAYRIGLRLDDAAKSYTRAVELDPKASNARRNLADLKRALGRPDEALALYREQLIATPDDLMARSGVILSLLDLGNEAEARTELHAALQKDRKNLPLLVGAAYWFAARNDFDHAYELAQQAVRVEPRYTWGDITLARALIGLKDAPAAERALRYAQQFGRFPTLSYELSNALVANGFYTEAAEELARAFTLRGGQIETKLAGRRTASASNFIELLAPERRAAIFQFVAADTDANARQLKSLLAFYLATKAASETNGSVELNDALAATDFIAGDDALSAFRQMYVANNLLSLSGRGRNFAARAFELAERAIRGADAAINSPSAPTAILAEDLRDLRARAIAQGVLPETPALSRQMLSNIFRGRIEDTAGWALFLDKNPSEAVVRLRRAISVLPKDSALWRNSMWHLGAALDASGNGNDALNAYLKSYDPRDPNPARRTIIEAAYQRVKGSLDGLDAQIGAASTLPEVAANTESSSAKTSTTPTPNKTINSAPTPTMPAIVAPSPVVAPTPTMPTLAMPDVAPNSNAEPSSTPATNVERESSDEKKSTGDEKNSGEKPASVNEPMPAPRNERPRRVKRNDEPPRDEAKCMTLSASEFEIERPGGSVTVTINLSDGLKASDIRAETPNWSDIIVLEQPSNPNDNGTVVFVISSTSLRGGTFKVVFKSPCGRRDVNINVKS